ncbi:hypothetical protein [Acetobacter fabarum]|uniref:hypothetical protein n=2 Tax=Acetobacter fabarum TaxID=483199 RepID=UPI0015CE764D|nr:hypothetical protein [Acetobacter fabarum]
MSKASVGLDIRGRYAWVFGVVEKGFRIDDAQFHGEAPDHGENWQAIASELICSFFNLLMFSAQSQRGRAGKAAPSGAQRLALARPPTLWQPFLPFYLSIMSACASFSDMHNDGKKSQSGIVSKISDIVSIEDQLQMWCLSKGGLGKCILL